MIYANNKLSKEYLRYRLNYLNKCLEDIPTSRTKAESIQAICDKARKQEIERLLNNEELATEFAVVERYKELEEKSQKYDYAMSSRLIELIDLLPENHWFRKEKETVVDENNTVSAKEFAIN